MGRETGGNRQGRGKPRVTPSEIASLQVLSLQGGSFFMLNFQGAQGAYMKTGRRLIPPVPMEYICERPLEYICERPPRFVGG